MISPLHDEENRQGAMNINNVIGEGLPVCNGLPKSSESIFVFCEYFS